VTWGDRACAIATGTGVDHEMNQRWADTRLSRRSLLAGIAGVGIASILVACGEPTSSAGDPRLKIVAAESFWGSIAEQLGGQYVDVTSLITNPNTDPHDFEPKPSDARTVADARYVILNGAGYDPWMQSLIDANPTEGRKILNVGDLVGKKSGDNPHLWYDPSFVDAVVERIAHDLSTLDLARAATIVQRQQQFIDTDLKPYHDLITGIKASYSGTPIGSTESIFVYMSEALGLDLITPTGYMDAISEGNDVAAADKATVDRQITDKRIAVLVYNAQNATPDTEAVKQKATANGIPVVGITETLNPRDATFQAWQVQQLSDLKRALATGMGR
jgi:zinc/manganese transport system substrate-binding protein